jgi:hypothetical protein
MEQTTPAIPYVESLSEQEGDVAIQPPVHAVEEVLTALSNAPRLPALLRSRNAREQLKHAFDLIGGIPRLAMWGHQNPGDFYKLWVRTVPTQITGENGGALRIELGWINGRDTTGRRGDTAVIDVQPIPGSQT